MKLKSVVVAMAAVAAASQVHALDPGDPIDVAMHLSGATAVDIQFANYISQVCVPGTLDEYRQNSDVARVFTCQVADANIQSPGNLSQATLNVMFRKASGGSNQGVEPVWNDDPIPGLDISVGCVEDLPANPGLWNCPDGNVNVEAQVGVSDVEPTMFSLAENGGAVFGAAGGWHVIGGSDADGEPQPINQQTFGIVVTEDLRDALQTAQGLGVGSDDVQDMPSLSQDVIARLFSGEIPTWDALVYDSTPLGPNQTITPIPVNSNDVEICMRSRGSGTGAQFNRFYLGNACLFRGDSTGAPLRLTVGNDCGGGETGGDITQCTVFGSPTPPHTHRNVGSSDLGKCLTNLDLAGRTGIGVQSIEKVAEDRADRNQFKYIKINGVAPTLANAQSGNYRNVASATLQWNDNTAADADRLLLAQELRRVAQDVGAVATFNASLIAATNFPSIGDGAGGLVPVGNLAYFGLPGNGAGQSADAVEEPSIGTNQGLSDPISCSIPRIQAGGVVFVGQQN